MTRRWLEKQGFTVATVETYNPWSKRRNDLFGKFDLLAVSPSEGIVGVQSSTKTNRSVHIRKLKEGPFLNLWLAAGGKVWLVLWAKYKNRWQCTVEQFPCENLQTPFDGEPKKGRVFSNAEMKKRKRQFGKLFNLSPSTDA